MSAKEKVKEYRGIDVDRMVYFVHSKEWKINPKGHTRTCRQQLLATIEKYEQVLKQVDAGKIYESERAKAHEESSREILKTGLVDFNWEDAAESEDIGEAVLHKIADDIYRFLAVIGGKEEYRLWQTRLNSITENI